MNQLLCGLILPGILLWALFAGVPAHNSLRGKGFSQEQLHTIQAPCSLKWISVPYSGVTIVLVPPKLSKECLIAQAKSLNQKTPNSRFEFFDAKGGTLNEYVAYYDACDQPFNWSRCENAGARWSERKEKWVQKHRVAVMTKDGRFLDCKFENCVH
jgi:hypothetical protein